MLTLIKDLYGLLTAQQRRRFLWLQALIVLMAMIELLGIVALGPFMAVVADPGLLETHPVLSRVMTAGGFAGPVGFLQVAGLMVLLTLMLGSGLSIYTTWRLARFSMQTGTELGDSLYQHYLQQDWLFHANTSTAHLTKQIAAETRRVTVWIIEPLMTINARLMVAGFVAVGLIAFDPMLALVAVTVFVAAYVFIFSAVREHVTANGARLSRTSAERFRLMKEGFDAIREVLLTHRETEFVARFRRSSQVLAEAGSSNVALSAMPRYLMELIAFTGMVALVLALLHNQSPAMDTLLPALTVYALAGFKLLPALQQIYASVASIRGNAAALDAIKGDLQAARAVEQKATPQHDRVSLDGVRTLRLQELRFSYPDTTTPVIDNVSMDIPLHSTVGIVGESGCGKSTLIDLILGLLAPDHGQLMLDDSVIDRLRCKPWQRCLSLVPSSVVLTAGSIAENIAFGVPPEDIDQVRLRYAVRLAYLAPLIADLPLGLDTHVGERGMRMSAGQRQRIGIARALYNDSDILVFDDATRALDGASEDLILDTIRDLHRKKTIIMTAHRLNTVRHCDIIYTLAHGRVTASGSYSQLLRRKTALRTLTLLQSS